MHFGKVEKRDEDGIMWRSSMSVYFANDEFIVMRRYASYGTVTLLSNIGGLFCLVIGDF